MAVMIISAQDQRIINSYMEIDTRRFLRYEYLNIFHPGMKYSRDTEAKIVRPQLIKILPYTVYIMPDDQDRWPEEDQWLSNNVVGMWDVYLPEGNGSGSLFYFLLQEDAIMFRLRFV